MAVVSGQAATSIHQLHDQLALALTWNRSDIAEEKIFNKDINWPPGMGNASADMQYLTM